VNRDAVCTGSTVSIPACRHVHIVQVIVPVRVDSIGGYTERAVDAGLGHCQQLTIEVERVDSSITKVVGEGTQIPPAVDREVTEGRIDRFERALNATDVAAVVLPVTIDLVTLVAPERLECAVRIKRVVYDLFLVCTV